MSTVSEPISIDPDLLQQHQIHCQVVNDLFPLLPDPIEATPESLAARNEAAIARVSELRPVNADEIDIALHYVLSRAQAADVMRSIREHAGDVVRAGQLMRQYALMLRTAQADRRLLMQVQAVRLTREATTGAADADAWSAYIARRRLQQAAEQGPVPRLPAPPPGPADAPALPAEQTRRAEPSAPAEPARPPTPSPAAAPTAPTAAAPAPKPPVHRPVLPADKMQPPVGLAPLAAFVTRLGQTGGDPSRDLAAEADRYATDYPERARIIRRHGEVSPDCDFPEPDDDLMYAIITGQSPALRALDPPRAEAA